MECNAMPAFKDRLFFYSQSSMSVISSFFLFFIFFICFMNVTFYALQALLVAP